MTRARRPSPQTLAILEALAAKTSDWSHGYDLCRTLGLKAGTVYPILIRLAERGDVETAWETQVPQGRPARHLYRLSAAGDEHVRELRRAEVQRTPPVPGHRAPGSQGRGGRGSRGMNPGAAPTPALPDPGTRRTAWVATGAALVSFGTWALLIRATFADEDPEMPVVQVLVGAVAFGWPYVIAAPTAVIAASRVAVGVDAPARTARVRHERPTRTPGRVGRRHAGRAREHHRLAA